MELELNRSYFPNGTNGELLLNGDRLCSTSELPWNNNRPKVSCIPQGRYELRKRWSQRFGKHFILLDVPERTHILVHAANYALKELKGCIAPVTMLTGEGRGTQARAALATLISIVYPFFEKHQQVFLTIQLKNV